MKLIFIFLIGLSTVFGSAEDYMSMMHEAQGWVPIEQHDDGITVSSKTIADLPVKAVMVSQILNVDPEILAQVVEDVSGYNRFLVNATRMDAFLLEQNETFLLGYQFVDVPLLSDRHYGFKMYRPDPLQKRVDWELLPYNEMTGFIEQYRPDGSSPVYLDTGVGSWVAEQVGEGYYQVSYRLIMDPGGRLPKRLADYVNRNSIVNVFKDAVAETYRRQESGGN